MSTWAVSISLGPVQRFIAAGRRSRDLWWGSTWLSELTWRLALVAVELPGVKGSVLPDKKRIERIVADRQQPPRFDRGYGGRVSNHLQLTVEAAADAAIQQVAQDLLEAASRGLAWIVCESFEEGKRQLTEAQCTALIDPNAWDEQISGILDGDFLEFFAAWAEVQLQKDSEDPVREAFKDADEHLQAVKMNRTFDAPIWTKPGRQKSHLDPGRDSVLLHHKSEHPHASRERRARARLGLSDGEHLDALGLARRVASFGPWAPRCEDLPVLPFPPVSRMAADPWLRGLGEDQLLPLRMVLAQAAKGDKAAFSAWCSLTCDPNETVEQKSSIQQLISKHLYPFDASILFDDGIATARAELGRLGLDDAPLKAVAAELNRLKEELASGVPEPYYAVLAMDGDGVGAALMNAKEQKAFLGFVKQLDKYADLVIRDDEAQSLRTHQGRAFYAGGDDLLGYLPLDHLLAALLDIDALFTREMEGVPGVSVSAGVVIAHVKDDLRAVRQAAQEALDRAKAARRDEGSARGYTCIVERPRSGAAREVCGPTLDLAPRLAGWVLALDQERVSLRTPEMLDSLADLQDEDAGISDTHPSILLAKGRALQQIRRDGGKDNPLLLKRIGAIKRWSDVRALAEELRIAARLHRSWQQGGERRAPLTATKTTRGAE